MQPSNTICVSQEGPANALALNKDCTQVVIAGRNVFKVFSIGENEFTEVCNLRVGKNLNLNFSSIDVAWSSIEENTLATAATNGAVVVWNLGRSGRSKQEHVFSDHKRTVNKVSFHLTEPSLLISGSQDGMMKCFDLRMKEVARTFISNTESIRDVQFSPHQAHTFAAVSENGGVQLWDVRRHERCLAQYTAHSGPVFACDWHPAAPRLATASRDKTIKVWDLQAKPTLEHTIYTIASVGHVKWRPQKKYQVASCALVLDCAVHVWDVRRPHVPLATFAEHRDVTTAIAWQGEPYAFLSTSRDCSLYRHQWSEAAHPVLWANPWGVCVSARGDIAHAAPERPLPALPTQPAPPAPSAPAAPPAAQTHLPTLPRKQPTAGSLSPAAQAILERAFPGGAGSVLVRHRARAPSPHAPVLACARRYRLRGAPTHELADHNAKVARENNRHMVAHVWEVVRATYSDSALPPPPAPPPPAPPPPRHAPHHAPPPLPLPFSVEEESIDEEIEEWAEGQFQYSGVLGLPTHTIYIPPAKYAKGRTPHDEEEPGWVSAASAHYVDVEAIDWSLPEEAFPLRAAAPLSAPGSGPTHPAHPAHPVQRLGDYTADEKEDIAEKFEKININHGNGSGTSSSPSSSGSGSGSVGSAPVNGTGSMAEEGSLSVRGVGGAGWSRAAPLPTAPPLAAALRLHAELGDVQTAACVLLALLEHRNDLFPYIDESLQEQWLLGYIELLQRHKMYNEATMVIKCAWVGPVWTLSQQSTSVAVCCARCGRRTRAHAACDHCRRAAVVCAVCRQIVRGLYAWCQGCSHGGHLSHMQAWVSRHALCPAGCGHRCTLTG